MADIKQTLLQTVPDRSRRRKPELHQHIFSRKQIEQAFLETFELVGGVSRLALWANQDDNYKDFLALLMKMAPREVAEATSSKLAVLTRVPDSPLNRRPAVVDEGEGVFVYDDAGDAA